MKGSWDVIVVTADETFSGMRHTQVLFASYLSGLQPVIYVQPPAAWHPFKIFGRFAGPAHGRVQVCNYINVLPASIPFFHRLNEKINSQRLRRLLRSQSAKNILVWHFDSWRGVFNDRQLKRTGHITHLYHVIDPFFRNPMNDILCSISNKIIITSPRNNQYYAKWKEKILNVPQVIDLAAEKAFNRFPSKHKVPAQPFLFLLGTVSDDLDLDLVSTLCSNTPVAIAGQIKGLASKKERWDSLLTSGKLWYYGLLKPEEFYPLLTLATAGLICYDTGIRSGNFSPLKAINYLVAGIPVVSNCDTEIAELEGKMIFTRKNRVDFETVCRQLLAGHLPTEPQAAENFLAQHSMSAATGKILSAIL